MWMGSIDTRNVRVAASVTEKGILVERQGRKATGLRDIRSTTAGLPINQCDSARLV